MAVLDAAALLQQPVPDAVRGSARRTTPGTGVLRRRSRGRRPARTFRRRALALEDSQGWVTARLKPPVGIFGSLDGVETGVRNLIRTRPLEVERVAGGPSRPAGRADVLLTLDDYYEISAAPVDTGSQRRSPSSSPSPHPETSARWT